MKKIYEFVNKISDLIQKPFEAISAFCIFTGMLAVFFQVIYRYIIVKFFSFSFPFTEEYARYTIVWLTYICASICLKEGSLVSLNLLYDRLPRIAKVILYYITRAMMALFLGAIIKYCIIFIPNAANFKSPILGLSGLFLYTLPILASVFMLFELIVETLGVICGVLEPFIGRAVDEYQDIDEFVPTIDSIAAESKTGRIGVNKR